MSSQNNIIYKKYCCSKTKGINVMTERWSEWKNERIIWHKYLLCISVYLYKHHKKITQNLWKTKQQKSFYLKFTKLMTKKYCGQHKMLVHITFFKRYYWNKNKCVYYIGLLYFFISYKVLLLHTFCLSVWMCVLMVFGFLEVFLRRWFKISL